MQHMSDGAELPSGDSLQPGASAKKVGFLSRRQAPLHAISSTPLASTSAAKNSSGALLTTTVPRPRARYLEDICEDTPFIFNNLTGTNLMFPTDDHYSSHAFQHQKRLHEQSQEGLVADFTGGRPTDERPTDEQDPVVLPTTNPRTPMQQAENHAGHDDEPEIGTTVNKFGETEEERSFILMYAGYLELLPAMEVMSLAMNLKQWVDEGAVGG
ncbi:unnamed protein product [Amoebophrya sp. A120]|nr:unnamed protein product [Amoebophrya sp. A120]|eukprot:GSA120T00010434001.1